MSRSDTQWAGDMSRYLMGLDNPEDARRVVELAGKVARLERERDDHEQARTAPEKSDAQD